MASSGPASIPQKLSFAKVAAMNVPNPQPSSITTTEEKPLSSKQGTRRSTIIKDGQMHHTTSIEAAPTVPSRDLPIENTIFSQLSVQDASPAHTDALLGTVNGTKSSGSGESLEDDQSHLSNSSTKQHSFETKSVASATTFAMDEKESIRPDDSASVRAVDDEDTGSIIGRNPSSRTERDVIMPPLRAMSDRQPGSNLASVTRRFHTLTNPPQFGTLGGPPQIEADLSEVSNPITATGSLDENGGREVPVPASPDEKLLDALASSKDRLSILQLEEKVLDFLAQNQSQYLELPPQNSYARLLAHKLADYYNLYHIAEEGQSIRIFRTSLSALPTSLAVLAQSIPVITTQPLGQTAVKIMRRAGVGPRQMSTAESAGPDSSIPSKTTSEAGQSEEGLTSPTDGTPSRDRSMLTRDEREAIYKAARERIFGGFQDLSVGESISTGDNSVDMSRSSSASDKKKNRRQKTPRDDTFEARSAFVPSYGPMQNMSFQGPYQPVQYVDQSLPQQYDNNFGNMGAVNYGTTPTQTYPGFDQNMQASNAMNYNVNQGANFVPGDQWSGMQAQSQGAYYPYPQGQLQYPQNMPPNLSPAGTPYPPQSPTTFQQQNWSPQQFGNPYQQQASMQDPPAGWNDYQAQRYGQAAYPTVQGTTPVQAASPVPALGAYGRSLFNPQTQSFIPGTGSSRSNSRQNGRKKGSSNTTSTFQGRNNFNSGNRSNQPTAAMSSHGSQPTKARESFDYGVTAEPEESITKKYGGLANLPKKPPPSRVSSQFDAPALQSSMRSTSGPVQTVEGREIGAAADL